MPAYIYECKDHGEFELRHPMSEVGSEHLCPNCSGTANPVIGGGSFQLKGGGWYKDGYNK